MQAGRQADRQTDTQRFVGGNKKKRQVENNSYTKTDMCKERKLGGGEGVGEGVGVRWGGGEGVTDQQTARLILPSCKDDATIVLKIQSCSLPQSSPSETALNSLSIRRK
jgi:hypothetical protein